MKKSFALIFFTFLFISSAFGKIVVSSNNFFVESKGTRNPIAMLNTLAQKKEISDVKLFSEGRVNLVLFAKNGEKEKLYSVDDDGFIYSIKPFTNYSIKDVDSDGMVTFKEEPERRYRINSKGIFLY